MIITDLMQFVGKNVKIYFEDGDIKQGKLEYVPAFSEMYKWKKPKHFYLSCLNEDLGFRAHHVKKVELI